MTACLPEQHTRARSFAAALQGYDQIADVAILEPDADDPNFRIDAALAADQDTLDPDLLGVLELFGASIEALWPVDGRKVAHLRLSS